MPQFMLIMRSTDEALAASKEVDFEEIITAMGRFNESLMEAGVMTGGAGLADASQGAVVRFGESGAASEAVLGAYGETPALLNGYWTIETDSLEDAVEWAKRCPLGPGNSIEVRRITDESDFADYADNEYIQKEEGWAEELAEKRARRELP
ncbi:YciI family protein [Microcella alkalica]|uniref:YCII-related domain-containing protein n=1 Tax=Microcella alkalica TaxID=355930 RepID=A0A839E994_9MICO|nr:YciI family protein [Microcella alkalica]MBA8847753.1 hypothetical protein [Microcella alkalica]